jgi:hypothetical protein
MTPPEPPTIWWRCLGADEVICSFCQRHTPFPEDLEGLEAGEHGPPSDVSADRCEDFVLREDLFPSPQHPTLPPPSSPIEPWPIPGPPLDLIPRAADPFQQTRFLESDWSSIPDEWKHRHFVTQAEGSDFTVDWHHHPRKGYISDFKITHGCARYDDKPVPGFWIDSEGGCIGRFRWTNTMHWTGAQLYEGLIALGPIVLWGRSWFHETTESLPYGAIHTPSGISKSSV